jgi:hypothetical protein
MAAKRKQEEDSEYTPKQQKVSQRRGLIYHAMSGSPIATDKE